MTGKVVEALAKILEGLNKNFSLEEVSSQLKKQKEFDQSTISAAFSLIFDKVLSKKIEKREQLTSTSRFRMLTEEEKDFIGMDNFNYITYLTNIGLMDAVDLEMILEQIMMYPDDSITRDDINWIIMISLIEFDLEIPPGSRVLLYSSDTIN
ncbi:MAG: DUF494 domain-containing protein [Bacteroidetes bacterium]|nr:DUF494 domain-containing protein [Bacteroidota bacterium]